MTKVLFEISSTTRIIFGSGTVARVVSEAAPFGERPLLVSGRNPYRCQTLMDSLRGAGHQTTLFQSDPEPTVDLVLQGVERAEAENCDFIVGLGGGSVIDTAKAISALLTNRDDPYEFLEVIGKGRPLAHPAAPLIAIPTTAGTGAEVTRNSVLGSPVHRVKVSLRSPLMLPRLAIVDPELTHSLPPSITASTGMDALTQVIEAFVSRKANPFTDALCREGIRRAARSLRRAFEMGSDAAAREDMALTSLFSGLALSHSGLGAVHGLAGPLGGLSGASHGEICATLLPHVVGANIRQLRLSRGHSQGLIRYQEVARLLTGKESAAAEEAIDWLVNLAEDFQIRSLADLGLKERDLNLAVEKATKASSMKGNPVELPDHVLARILADAR